MRFLIIAVAVLVMSCSKNNDNNEAREYTVKIEPGIAEPWQWAYISLADGTVSMTEPAEWDIAVLRYMFAEMALRTPSDTAEKPIKFRQGLSVGETDIVWSGVEALDFGFDKMPPQYTMLPAHTWGAYTVQFTAYNYRTGELTFTIL